MTVLLMLLPKPLKRTFAQLPLQFRFFFTFLFSSVITGIIIIIIDVTTLASMQHSISVRFHCGVSVHHRRVSVVTQ